MATAPFRRPHHWCSFRYKFRALHSNPINYRAQQSFSKQAKASKINENTAKLQYSWSQTLAQYTAYSLMAAVTACSVYGTYTFHQYYVKPRQELFKKNEKYSLSSAERDKMIKNMANRFTETMEFTTHQNENINGLDILKCGKFFILYCGYPDCKEECIEILRTIKSSLESNKYAELLSILYIDINIFDSAEKVKNYFTNTLRITSDSNVNVIGLIPKDRDTLREVMESFGVFIAKRSGNGENMQLDHSNMVYFVDKDGLLYEILGGQGEVTRENVSKQTHNLLNHSESTFLGRLRNTMSLSFQTTQIRQMPDRHVRHDPVPKQE